MQTKPFLRGEAAISVCSTVDDLRKIVFGVDAIRVWSAPTWSIYPSRLTNRLQNIYTYYTYSIQRNEHMDLTKVKEFGYSFCSTSICRVVALGKECFKHIHYSLA